MITELKAKTDGELLAGLFELLATGVGVAREVMTAELPAESKTAEWLGWMGTQMALTARAKVLLDKCHLTEEQREWVEKVVGCEGPPSPQPSQGMQSLSP